MRLVVALVVIWISSASICAADHKVTSMGARTCSEWSQDRKHPDWSALLDQTWAVGFLSGYVAHSGNDLLNGVKPDSIFGLVDAYCLANPKSNVYESVNQVASDLERREIKTR